MAEKFVEIIQPDIRKGLCVVEGKNEKYLGYKKDILTDDLSERDAVFFCNRCQGMMREVCISTDGGQFCSCCKKENEQANPNIQMDNMILSFQCSCPLITRGCKWLGVLGGCQNHLDTCGYVYETCKLRCGVVLQRNELNVHEMEKCPQRIVKCEHCNNEFESCELHTHLELCPKMEVSCELKCGVVMCREVMTQHLEVDCPEKAIECPYAKYKCVGLIKRKDMSKHLEERRVEHLELKLNDFIMEESEISAKQKEKISEQSATIEIMSQEIKSLKIEMKNINSIPIRLEWITKVPAGSNSNIKKLFLIAGYQFEFDFYSTPSYYPIIWNTPDLIHILIRICPQNGFYYEKLK